MGLVMPDPRAGFKLPVSPGTVARAEEIGYSVPMRITAHIALPILLVLAACTTPREACVENAEAEYRGLQTAIAITEANVARGYALDREQYAYRGATFCAGGTFGNNPYMGLSNCNSTRYRTVVRPVPIDIEEEERKLASMRARLPVARERRDAKIGACYQQFER